MKETDIDLCSLTQQVVRALVSLDASTHPDVVIKQCRAAAETIGTMMAPQLYGARIHGIGNAVSVVIRTCSEALFWLNFSENKSETAISAVERLRDALMSPTM